MGKFSISNIQKKFITINYPSHRVLRYVLKVGDLEEATHVFIDLLQMRVFDHQEYEGGSADGGEVHYEGKWSSSLVGYGETENGQPSLQLTFNHGIAKYSRGNHFQGIEIQLGKTSHLEDVGLGRGFCRGKPAFLVDCNGYNIEVVKSDDGENRISCVILNCDESIKLSGPTVNFWTECLGFEIVSWSTDPKKDTDKLVEYSWPAAGVYKICCCMMSCGVKRKSVFKPLMEGELPYVDLQYGCSTDFNIRLQSLPKDVPMDIGTGIERLFLTCTKDDLTGISERVRTIGRHQGGSQSKKSFQLVHGMPDLMGVVATDPSGLEVCYYDDAEVKNLHVSQLYAETRLRQSISMNRKKFEERTRRRFKTAYHNYQIDTLTL